MRIRSKLVILLIVVVFLGIISGITFRFLELPKETFIANLFRGSLIGGGIVFTIFLLNFYFSKSE